MNECITALEYAGGVTAIDITVALAELARVPVLSLRGMSSRGDYLREFPAEMLKRHRAVPVAPTASTRVHSTGATVAPPHTTSIGPVRKRTMRCVIQPSQSAVGTMSMM